MTALSPFAYRQKTFDPTDIAEQVNALHDDGFALVPGILDDHEIAALRNEIDRLEPFGFDHIGLNDHFKCVFNRSKLFLDLIDRPGVIDLADALMGEQCHIIGETAWRSKPGHNGWGVHTDQLFVSPLPESLFDDPDFQLPIWVCTAHYYLNDQTIDLCPTYVIAGSHKSGRGPKAGEESWGGRELEPVLCKAGDMLFFRSEVWHTGSKNTSDDTRYLIQVHYSQRNFAQKFSPFPWKFNEDLLAEATPRQRRLLGDHTESNYG